MNTNFDSKILKKTLKNNPPIGKKHVIPFKHPYDMHPTLVKISHFYDARVYDLNAEDGYKVQRRVAKKAYRRFLLAVRQQWPEFRKIPREEFEMEDVDNDRYQHKITQRKRNNDHSENIMIYNDEESKPKFFTKKMGKQIIQFRNQLNLTQTELAKKIDVDPTIIRDIELGDIVIYNNNNPFIKRLAWILGLSSIRYQE
uniref:HTH cro/C1-type domain-containing protein n=1 Tax=viral metagenome TaxID=1070528 RepID=A0A6C0LU26_9ZZZZ